MEAIIKAILADIRKAPLLFALVIILGGGDLVRELLFETSVEDVALSSAFQNADTLARLAVLEDDMIEAEDADKQQNIDINTIMAMLEEGWN